MEGGEGAGAAGTGWSLTGRGRGETGHTVADSQVGWGPPDGSEEYQEVEDWEEDVETHKQAVSPENNQIFKEKSLRLDLETDGSPGRNI